MQSQISTGRITAYIDIVRNQTLSTTAVVFSSYARSSGCCDDDLREDSRNTDLRPFKSYTQPAWLLDVAAMNVARGRRFSLYYCRCCCSCVHLQHKQPTLLVHSLQLSICSLCSLENTIHRQDCARRSTPQCRHGLIRLWSHQDRLSSWTYELE